MSYIHKKPKKYSTIVGTSPQRKTKEKWATTVSKTNQGIWIEPAKKKNYWQIPIKYWYFIILHLSGDTAITDMY